MGNGTGKWYTNIMFDAFNGNGIDWANDDIRVSLHTAAYTPSQDGDAYFSDTSNEVSGNGYADTLLTTKSISTGSAVVNIDGGDTVWTASGGSIEAKHAVVWKSVSEATQSQLISYVTFDATESATDGNTFTITWSADGVVKATVTT